MPQNNLGESRRPKQGKKKVGRDVIFDTAHTHPKNKTKRRKKITNKLEELLSAWLTMKSIINRTTTTK